MNKYFLIRFLKGGVWYRHQAISNKKKFWSKNQTGFFKTKIIDIEIHNINDRIKKMLLDDLNK